MTILTTGMASREIWVKRKLFLCPPRIKRLLLRTQDCPLNKSYITLCKKQVSSQFISTDNGCWGSFSKEAASLLLQKKIHKKKFIQKANIQTASEPCTMTEAFELVKHKQQLVENDSQLKLIAHLDTLQKLLIEYFHNNKFEQQLQQAIKRYSSQTYTDLSQHSSSWINQALKILLKNDDSPNRKASPTKQFLPSYSDELKCLYIWGGVGQGKTMLMDLFFHTTPLKKKLKLHFHDFILDIHKRLYEIHSHKSSVSKLDPIISVAYTISSSYSLICLDEFQVLHISDAMILKSLFEALYSVHINSTYFKFISFVYPVVWFYHCYYIK